MNPRNQYRWNDKAGRYVNRRTGRFVAFSEVQEALNTAIENGAKAMRELSKDLKDRKIDLATWQTEMMKEIKMTHLNSAAAAKGGWAQMTQADYGRVGGIVTREYRYLRNFAKQIASGEQKLDGRFLMRAEQYIKAGRETYHRTLAAEQEKRGYDEERSVLNPADHCPDCVLEAAKGWQKMGLMIVIGKRQCRHNCRCSRQARNSSTGVVMS